MSHLRYSSQTLAYQMKQKISFSIRFGIVALLLLPWAPCRATAQTRDSGDVKSLSLGLVSETDQKEIEGHFQEFMRYVTRKLSPEAKMAANVIVASSPLELAKLLTERKVDFYMESAYPTYIINIVQGSGKLLLRRWKGGLADYFSVIFTKRGSGVSRLEDLKGKTIVFEDAGSTSGYLLPKLFLQRQGLQLTEKSRMTQDAASNDVGYVFAGSQVKLVEAVFGGRVAAGAFSNDDLNALEDAKKLDIVLLAQTERLPRHLLSVRNDLAPSLAAHLEKILLAMDGDAEGRKVLQKTDGTTKFDILPGGETAMRRRLLESFYSPGPK
jgi:phosphonate transport system substrate-binding protein